MSKKTNKDPYKEQRRDWGNVRPCSVAHTDKSKYTRKVKHRKDWE